MVPEQNKKTEAIKAVTTSGYHRVETRPEKKTGKICKGSAGTAAGKDIISGVKFPHESLKTR